MFAFIAPVIALNLLVKKYANHVFSSELHELEKHFSSIVISAHEEHLVFLGSEAKIILDLDRWEGGCEELPARIVRIAKNKYDEYFYIVLQEGDSEAHVTHIPRARAQLILQEHPDIFFKEFGQELHI